MGGRWLEGRFRWSGGQQCICSLCKETYIPRQISDNETTSVRCSGSKLLEPLLEYTRNNGSLVSMAVKLRDGLLSLIMRREDQVG